MMAKSFDLIIVGGGLAGLSLACALRETRLNIALLEQRPPRPTTGWDARIYAVSPANARFLERIGAWKHLDRTRITPIRTMRITGDAGARLAFHADEAGVDTLAWTLESSRLAGELWESARRQANVTVFCPAAPQRLVFDTKAVQLTLADGQTLAARLLVGADGRDSWVREAAGLKIHHTPYGEKGVVANFTCAEAHRDTAFQWFRDDGVLAWLPLPGRRISMVWSTPDAHAEALLALPPDALCARVAQAGTHALGDLRPLTPAAAFPLGLLRVPQITAPRLTLLGDAAHGIHPLSGHGVNLGFADAAALAGALAAAPEWQDIGESRLLRRYARARREETLLLQYTTHTLHRLFREKLPALQILRNAGMALTDRLGLVKSLLVRYARET